MFVGYPANRESDSVCMWDPSTNGEVTTRDVIWIKRMYYVRPKDVFFDIKYSPLETEVKDAEEVIKLNDGTVIKDSEGTKDES
jgi:hypothetical protein